MSIAPQQISSKLRMMPDAELQQYAAMHQNDPYIFPLAFQESQDRKQMRSEAMAQQAGQAKPPVVQQDLAQMGPPNPMPNMPTGIPLQGAGSMEQAPEPEQQATKLPEEHGIGALPANNLKGMKEGGITGYADEGAVKGNYSPAFMENFYRTLNLEGGPTTDTGGYTKYGISQKAHPGIDVRKLTKDDAARIYKTEYWDKINGDRLHNVNPALASTLFDAAVNQSVSKANKYLTASNGDPNKVMDMRRADYNALVASNPDMYGKYQEGWNNRLDKLSNSIGLAQANTQTPPQQAPQQPAQPQSFMQALTSGQGPLQAVQGVGDTAYNILGFPMDVSHQITKVFGNKTPEENVIGTSAYLKKKATEAGIRPADSTDTTLQGFRKAGELGGAFLTPGGVGKTAEAGISGLESLGMRAANKISPTTKVTPGGLADLQKLQEETAIRNAQNAGATVEEQEYLQDMMNRNKAQPSALPDIPFKTTQAAPTKADMLGLARTSGVGIPLSQDTQFAGPPPSDNASASNLPPDDGFSSPDFSSLAPTPGVDKIADTVTQGAKGGRDWNDFLLNMGLGLMAGKSPYALQNLGEAGIGALRQEQEAKKQALEERKIASEEAYQKALSAHYGVTPEIQLVQAMKDPEFAKQYQSLVSAKSGPMTQKDLIDNYMKTLKGQAGDFSGFNDFVQQMSPYMGTMPSGVTVTKRGG